MLITAEIPREMAAEVDRLVRVGTYPSHSALLRAALNNLLTQERHRETSFLSDVRIQQMTELQLGREGVSREVRTMVVSPELVSPEHMATRMPLSYFANRLLPVKAVVTNLLDYLHVYGVPRANLAKFSIHTAEECVKLKARLAQFDDTREVKPSTSFPDPTPKGMQRFIQVYVGGRRGDDVAFGVIASLGFVGFVTSTTGDEEIAFTDRGYQLATVGSELEAFLHGETDTLPDPLFDSREFNLLVESLLTHEGEAGLVKYIMRLLQEKPVGRNELNNAVRGYFEGSYPGETKSSSVVSTHAAATVLRLRELGLVEGKWSGGTIEYQLTEGGRRWAKEVGLW
jgi:Arc/MetJ-type ribon-helix-helix transcriptional regulator